MHLTFKFCKMGMSMSFMGKGLPSTPTIGSVMGTIYERYVDREINNFDEFHSAILDIFSTFNSALPGEHYDVPSRKEVEACFSRWEKAPESEKEKCFVEFMKEKIKASKLDDFTLIVGMATPAAAMAAKRAGEIVPQLKIIKAIPDVIFVPTVTVLALVSAKLTRRTVL